MLSNPESYRVLPFTDGLYTIVLLYYNLIRKPMITIVRGLIAIVIYVSHRMS